MQDRIAALGATGNAIIRHYRFDSLDMGLVIPFGVQTGLSLGVTGAGDVTVETRDAAGTLVDTRTEPFQETFILRRATGDRWLNVGVRPEEQTP